MSRFLATLAVFGGLAGCGRRDDPALSLAERSPGGATTVVDASTDAFGRPAANLSPERSDRFFVGNSFFKTNWVAAPASAEGRDGLGPLYNALSCSSCHVRDGRGRPPLSAGEPFGGLLLRISEPGTFLPDPVYGDQIQPFAVHGVKGEAVPKVDYTEQPGRFRDGTAYSLRSPRYRLEDAAYGPIRSDLLISPRVAPALVGLGLLETIPEQRLRELEDERDANGDGISGRINVGRFGWKASQPTVEAQCAAAFVGDIGLTSPLAREENTTPAQLQAGVPRGDRAPELSQEKLDLVTFYMKTLAVPARRSPDGPQVLRGRAIFSKAGCQKCHTPEHTTGSDPRFPELSGQRIFPYTDLLLHDLGADLADGRPDHRADGREWRTPPLWGIGLVEKVSGHTFFLHDGRARTLTEAILWHDGEARASKEFFRNLSADERAALLAFLEDL